MAPPYLLIERAFDHGVGSRATPGVHLGAVSGCYLWGVTLVRFISAAALALALPACTATASASIAAKDMIVVGVKADQPGLGFRGPDGTFRGFEVDFGEDIARRLGAAHVTFKEVTSNDREAQLNARTVDFVLASYSITPDRSKLVTFGGPYYVAHQDMMVRKGDTRIRTVRDMAGRRMCQASGSVSSERIMSGLSIPVVPVAAPSYSACFDLLLKGTVDVMSTGDLVLAGFAAQGSAGKERVHIINAPFTDERYGVGLRRGDIDGCEGVNKAITQMYQDGTAIRLLKKWFGSTDLRLTGSVPQYEGCS